MMQWQTNLKMMASKERQYLQQLANYKVSVIPAMFEWGYVIILDKNNRTDLNGKMSCQMHLKTFVVVVMMIMDKK
jgi:hypothetical protein